MWCLSNFLVTNQLIFDDINSAQQLANILIKWFYKYIFTQYLHYRQNLRWSQFLAA